MNRVLIVGAGGHGQVVADILLCAERQGAPVMPIGFVDDDESLHGRLVLGLPVIGKIESLREMDCDGVVVAIGDNRSRWQLVSLVKDLGLSLANAIHPLATISPSAELGQGVMACAGAIVNTGSTIGDGAILNTGCSVDHHNQIGACAHVGPGAHLGGAVSVGEGALVGIGAIVVPGRAIGPWAIVGAGSTVTKDLPGHCTAVGSPARVVRRRRTPVQQTEV